MKTQFGVLAGLTAVGAALVMSAATAPHARADDITDIANAIESDYAAGQSAFSDASSAFASAEPGAGLTYVLAGFDDDAVSTTNNLLTGTVEALTGESITGSLTWDLAEPATFTVALGDLSSDLAAAQGLASSAVSEFTAGAYGLGTFDELFAGEFATVIPLEEILIGSLNSL